MTYELEESPTNKMEDYESDFKIDKLAEENESHAEALMDDDFIACMDDVDVEEDEEKDQPRPRSSDRSRGGNGRCLSFRSQADLLENMNCTTDDAEESNQCGICNKKLFSPRILSCLHVFCEACLDKIAESRGTAIAPSSIVKCSMCQQETLLGSKGAASLPCDYILSNMLDMTAIKNESVLCTSCKATENAVARCSDCAHFLCPNCNAAHQYMRCFENHKVIPFNELKKSEKTIPIHKPIFCGRHPEENVKFYCYSCREPICNECLLIYHKAPEHLYERLKDAEPRQKEELYNLVTESKARIEQCDQISSQLENALGELQDQRDQVKDLINESYQSYKVILEMCRDDALNNLEIIHSRRELEIMDTFHNVEQTIEKIECACEFTNRLLEHGNADELMSLCDTATNQLSFLIDNMPKPNVTSTIEFQTDYNTFEKTIKKTFGKVCSSPEIGKHIMDCNNNRSRLSTMYMSHSTSGPSSLNTSSPLSLTTSIQSSFDSDTSFIIPPTASPNIIPLPYASTSNLVCNHGLASIQEYNLEHLANFSEKVEIPGNRAFVVRPNSNPSPTPSINLSDVSPNDLVPRDHVISRLQTLARLGNFPPTQDHNPSTVVDTGIVLNGGFHLPKLSTSPALSQAADEVNGESIQNMSSMMNNLVTSNENLTSNQIKLGATPKLTPMQIRWKFGQLGPNKGHFNSPHGFCLGVDEDIIVADTNNHRIQIFDKTGVFKFQFGIPGKDEGQLWYPRKVAVVRNNGKFVVCDRGNERSRMQIFAKNGHFIKKIAIRHIDIVAGLAVTSHGFIVAVDSVAPSVFIMNDNGDLLRWFDCSDYMREPSDIAINGKELYVCDFKGHCVVVFDEHGHFVRRIGNENITNFPNGIDISDAGDILIGDSHGNRFHVAVFSKDGTLISEFECPYVKVSRCCGLKITSEGYIVTLAKNNHHVLVLNTLYIV